MEGACAGPIYVRQGRRAPKFLCARETETAATIVIYMLSRTPTLYFSKSKTNNEHKLRTRIGNELLNILRNCRVNTAGTAPGTRLYISYTENVKSFHIPIRIQRHRTQGPKRASPLRTRGGDRTESEAGGILTIAGAGVGCPVGGGAAMRRDGAPAVT